MSSELERRLEGLLGELPEPEPEVGERALTASLAALRPAAARRHGLGGAVVVFAAAFVLLAIAAGSLAAAGDLHVSFGHETAPPPATPLSLPKGANGIAVVVNGKLDVVTKTGLRLEGLPVSSAALSPQALYVAAGVGDSLVAMAPDGRRAWSHPAGGPVRAIAWAPDGLRIAYVVGREVHVIYGNGFHDTVIDRSVRAVRPSWRADSLAFAYVGAGGKAIVYSLVHASRRVVAGFPAGVVQLAFAPSGSQLALRSADRVGANDIGGTVLLPRRSTTGIGWIGGAIRSTHVLVASAGRYVFVEPVGVLQPAYRPLRLGGRVVNLAADGRRFVATVAGRSPGIVAGTRIHWQTVLHLGSGQRASDIEVG